jgi:hypothetical protein
VPAPPGGVAGRVGRGEPRGGPVQSAPPAKTPVRRVSGDAAAGKGHSAICPSAPSRRSPPGGVAGRVERGEPRGGPVQSAPPAKTPVRSASSLSADLGCSADHDGTPRLPHSPVSRNVWAPAKGDPSPSDPAATTPVRRAPDDAPASPRHSAICPSAPRRRSPPGGVAGRVERGEPRAGGPAQSAPAATARVRRGAW